MGPMIDPSFLLKRFLGHSARSGNSGGGQQCHVKAGESTVQQEKSLEAVILTLTIRET